jgi:hypothetical protein
VGAALDRNGLRPCRYFVAEDGLIGAASEAGAIPIGDRRVVVRGKLGPGQMILVETHHSVFLEDGQIKSELASRQPYGAWVKQNVRHLSSSGSGSVRSLPVGHARPPDGMSTRCAQEAAHGAIAAEYQRPATSDQVAFITPAKNSR